MITVERQRAGPVRRGLRRPSFVVSPFGGSISGNFSYYAGHWLNFHDVTTKYFVMSQTADSETTVWCLVTFTAAPAINTSRKRFRRQRCFRDAERWWGWRERGTA